MNKDPAGAHEWRSLTSADAPQMSIVLGWIHEAGNPYFDWFFGGSAAARSALEARVQSAGSEVSADLITALASRGGEILGGFIGLNGAELERRRQDDAVAYLRRSAGEDRSFLAQRMRASQELFPAVEHDEIYLSKMGVRDDVRGQGLGRILVNRFLDLNVAGGWRRFRLDVHADNVAAIKLYESVGFEVTRESHSSLADMTYLAMRAVLPEPHPAA